MQPRARADMTFQMVPHTAGALPLPQLRITAPALGVAVDVLQARRIFVAPTPLGGSAGGAGGQSGVKQAVAA